MYARVQVQVVWLGLLGAEPCGELLQYALLTDVAAGIRPPS